MQTKTTNEQKIKHLYNRAGFGISPQKLNTLQASIPKTVHALLAESREYSPLEVVTAQQVRMVKEARQAAKSANNPSGMTAEKVRAMIKDRIEDLQTVNLAWMNRMVSGKQVLREKMTLFWHGHFACRNHNAYFMQTQNNTLRQHALGKFGDLLRAISKDAAMLAFLNNRQNRKDSPNENFAREVMELFTLGRGHYTEQDVKNAARAFTGWQFRGDGEFYFHEKQHDTGSKTFLGKTGNFTGEDILQLLLENKQTARFISTKIYRYFVNDTPDEEKIKTLAEQLYRSDYDISQLMESIFRADWFYEPDTIGCRIKSPVELLVGLRQTFGVEFQESQNQVFLQKVLGQTLLFPPSVAGWKEGRNWIDSSSLLFRMQLPGMIFHSVEVAVDAKDEGDVNTAFMARRQGRNIRATANWSALQQAFAHVKEPDTLDELASYLLSYPITGKQKDMIWRTADRSTRKNLIQSLSIALISLPEYQLC